MEFLVGIMLVYLGVNLIFKLRNRNFFHLHEHTHDGYRHIHPHIHTLEDINRTSGTVDNWHHDHSYRGRSLFIGLVHGFAGSAALMLVVLATINSSFWAVVYIAVFGIGSIGGMMLMSVLLSIPFVVAHKRLESWFNYVQIAAATLSIIFGAFLMIEIAFVQGLVL